VFALDRVHGQGGALRYSVTATSGVGAKCPRNCVPYRMSHPRNEADHAAVSATRSMMVLSECQGAYGAESSRSCWSSHRSTPPDA